jgi:hypothetical protein
VGSRSPGKITIRALVGIRGGKKKLNGKVMEQFCLKWAIQFLGKNLNLLLNCGVFKDIFPFSKNDKDYTFCKQVYKSS